MSSSFIRKLHERNQRANSSFPDKESVEDFVNKLFHFLFPAGSTKDASVSELEKEFDSLKSYLSTLVYSAGHTDRESQAVAEQFFYALPQAYDVLLNDAAAIARFDPAATSTEEVVVAYPGFYAIAVYRLAHELYQLQVKSLPRLFTEYAHRQTGIDIHPGAAIGNSFFIDHGTGVVIGETSVVGNNVKIYQGVTIGALLGTSAETKAKRHPTIEDDVTIYAGATILGGNTVIGRGTTVGGNVWITETVPANSYVFQKNEVLSASIYKSLSSDHLIAI